MDYYKHLKLEDIIIYDQISLDTIYKTLAKDKIELIRNQYKTILEKSKLIINVEKHPLAPKLINIQIIKNNEVIKNIRDILEKPFSITFYKNNQEKENLSIISNNHLLYVLEKLEFKNPIFNCSLNNFHEKLKYLHMFSHSHCKYIHYINEEINYDKINNNYLKEKLSRKLKNFYNIPEEFEPNYKYYFSYYEYQKKRKFEIYLDETRSNLFRRFFSSQKGKLTFYYGSSGNGKSISLILFSKFNFNFQMCGTLYINCKTFYKLLKENKTSLIKELLKSEIAYLFGGEFDNFKHNLLYINNFKITNIHDFWKLIYDIIQTLNNEQKKYYIFFDQYKDTFIDKNYIIQILDSIKLKNICIIACCSLNDKDIRIMKISTLFEKKWNNDDLLDRDDIIIESIENVMTTDRFTIDNGGIFDHKLDIIGKTVKNYNILSFINEYGKEKEKELDKFIENQRNKIKQNILDFFNININSNSEIGNKRIFDILTFSVGVEYNINYLKCNIDYLPLKYFDIKIKNKEEKGEIGNIEYLYPLVEEAFVAVYNFIINRNRTIYKILKDSNIIAGGAQGHLFEKYVIYNINPKNKENKCIYLFNSLLVNKNELLDKFLPDDNEKFRGKKSKIKRKNLEDGTYFFEQRIFGGKSFDAAIIKLITKGGMQEAKVFLFQISMHTEKIFTISDLQKDIKTMIEYQNIYHSFTIKEENVYFTYIFDISCPINCLEKCKEKNIPYIFYSSQDNSFISSEGNNIVSMDNIFICPLTSKLLKLDSNIMKDNNIYKVFNVKHKLGKALEKYIIKVIKKYKDFGFANDFIKIKFIRSNKTLHFFKNYNCLCLLKVINEKEKKFIFSF